MEQTLEDETSTTIGTLINNATVKTTPVDADMVGLMDSVASNIVKKLSWANIKATLQTYFNTLYASISHTHTKSDVGLGSVSNYEIATQAEAEAGTSSAKYMTPQRTSQAVAVLSPVKSSCKTRHSNIDKSDVGLVA